MFHFWSWVYFLATAYHYPINKCLIMLKCLPSIVSGPLAKRLLFFSSPFPEDELVTNIWDFWSICTFFVPPTLHIAWTPFELPGTSCKLQPVKLVSKSTEVVSNTVPLLSPSHWYWTPYCCKIWPWWSPFEMIDTDSPTKTWKEI